MTDADPASTLAGIRERYECGAKITATGRDVCASADDVPSLLKAIEAALEAADDFHRDAGKYGEKAGRIGSSLLVIRAQELEACAVKLRAAVTAALGGTQQGEDRDRG